MSEPKYKIGDRVRVINGANNHLGADCDGLEGTVSDDHTIPHIELDDGRCNSFMEEDLELIPKQLTPQVCKDKMVEHMATDEDYEKLEDVVKGIKSKVIHEPPSTEPNFGTEDVLEEALRITGGDRMADYGPPDQDFRRTAIMWEQLLNGRIVDGKLQLKPQDVASCMIALKLSRQTHQGKRDNWTDIAGYARCGNLCEELET